MLSPDTAREVVRFDAVEALRLTPGAGLIASDSSVLRRDIPPCAEAAVRTELER